MPVVPLKAPNQTLTLLVVFAVARVNVIGTPPGPLNPQLSLPVGSGDAPLLQVNVGWLPPIAFNAVAPVASEIFVATDILAKYIGGAQVEIPYFTQSVVPEAVRSTVCEDNGVEAPLKVMTAAFSGKPIKKVVAIKAMTRACVFFMFCGLQGMLTTATTVQGDRLGVVFIFCGDLRWLVGLIVAHQQCSIVFQSSGLVNIFFKKKIKVYFRLPYLVPLLVYWILFALIGTLVAS